MANNENKNILAFWNEELNTSYLYKQIAKKYGDSPLAACL